MIGRLIKLIDRINNQVVTEICRLQFRSAQALFVLTMTACY